MSDLLKIPEGASLAVHAMVVLAARRGEPATTGEIAGIIHASGNHLSKVLQRLSKVGLVRAHRGRKGGFELGRESDQISLLEVYEAMEGPISSRGCLLGHAICGGNCVFGSFLETVGNQFKDFLANEKLSVACKFDG